MTPPTTQEVSHWAKGFRMSYAVHRVMWRLLLKGTDLKLRRWWCNFVEWHIKSRFGCGLWRRTRYMRLVPRVIDNKPVWTLCQDEKRFFGYRKVEIATAATPEELLPLAEHRMQPARFLRKKRDGTVTIEPETAGEEALTWMVKVIYDGLGKKVATTAWHWEPADASDELRPKGAAAGATVASGDGEVHAQSAKEARDVEAQSGEATQDAPPTDRVGSASEEVASEVSSDSAEVLDGGKR